MEDLYMPIVAGVALGLVVQVAKFGVQGYDYAFRGGWLPNWAKWWKR